MIDRAHTEDALFRVSVSALRYYPGKPNVEPGYTLNEDVEWCLEPLAELPVSVVAELRRTIGLAIIDPTGFREALQEDLNSLADE